MITFLVAVLVASLVGSLHCAGMCGGIVVLCVEGTPVKGPDRWWPHVAYHLGRGLSYITLGAVSGAVGAAIDLGGGALGASRIAAYVAGGAMILLGLASIARQAGVRLPHWRPAARVADGVGRRLAALRRRGPVTRGAGLGLLTVALPCGWLYAFVLAAAGTGRADHGALTMAAFWLGTVPILLGLGLGLQCGLNPLRRAAPLLTSLALVLVGVVAVTGRFGVPAYAETLQARVAVLDDEPVLPETSELPCCHEQPVDPVHPDAE